MRRAARNDKEIVVDVLLWVSSIASDAHAPRIEIERIDFTE